MDAFRFPPDPKRQAIAYHEAMHATVTYLLGDVPTSCKLLPGDQGGRVTRLGANKLGQDAICMCLAGPAMDRRLGSHIEHGHEKDYKRAWKIAFDSYERPDDAIKAFNQAERRIDRLVTRAIPGAMLLGRELYKRGKLDREEIDAILSRSVKRLKSPRVAQDGGPGSGPRPGGSYAPTHERLAKMFAQVNRLDDDDRRKPPARAAAKGFSRGMTLERGAKRAAGIEGGAYDELVALIDGLNEPRSLLVMFVEVMKQAGFTPEQIMQKITQMSTPNDDLNKKLNWSGSGAAAEDEDPHMPLNQQPNMQQMEDPNKIGAATMGSGEPTQHATFSRDLSSNTPQQDPAAKGRGQAFGVPGPAGAEPGTRAPSSQLKPGNGSGKFDSLIELLDALEGLGPEDMDEDEELGGMMDQEEPQPLPLRKPSLGQAPLGQAPAPPAQLPNREAAPLPVKMPAAQDLLSYSVGDARIMAERRMPDRRVDQYLRQQGMRSEAHRTHVIEGGQRQRARNNVLAQDRAAKTSDDFAQFCPGATKIDVLDPMPASVPARQQTFAQDSADKIWTWWTNPTTNMIEQIQVTRAQFMRMKTGD